MPNEVTREVYDNVRSIKKWVVLPGARHDDVYLPPVRQRHMDEVREWMTTYLAP